MSELRKNELPKVVKLGKKKYCINYFINFYITPIDNVRGVPIYLLTYETYNTEERIICSHDQYNKLIRLKGMTPMLPDYGIEIEDNEFTEIERKRGNINGK